MNNIIKVAGATVAALAMAASVQALPITGNIGFVGSVTLDTASVNTATAVTSWISPAVSGGSGVFSSISQYAPASFNPQVWNFNTSTPITAFWSVDGFTFDLVSSYISGQGDGDLSVKGTGTVSGNGYTPTTLSWSFSTQDPASKTGPDQWTFSASANSTPDGGATLMLLGLGLSTAALLRKKLSL